MEGGWASALGFCMILYILRPTISLEIQVAIMRGNITTEENVLIKPED